MERQSNLHVGYSLRAPELGIYQVCWLQFIKKIITRPTNCCVSPGTMRYSIQLSLVLDPWAYPAVIGTHFPQSLPPLCTPLWPWPVVFNALHKACFSFITRAVSYLHYVRAGITSKAQSEAVKSFLTCTRFGDRFRRRWQRSRSGTTRQQWGQQQWSWPISSLSHVILSLTTDGTNIFNVRTFIPSTNAFYNKSCIAGFYH